MKNTKLILITLIFTAIIFFIGCDLDSKERLLEINVFFAEDIRLLTRGRVCIFPSAFNRSLTVFVCNPRKFCNLLWGFFMLYCK
jgi:hypothetical protein